MQPPFTVSWKISRLRVSRSRNENLHLSRVSSSWAGFLCPERSETRARRCSHPQTKIDPAKEADIRRLLELTGASKIVKETMESMTTSIRPVLANSLPPGEYREKLIDLFFAKFQAKADITQLLELAIPAYDRYFSHEEIKGLIKFYETPLGQKSLSAMPQLMNEMRDAGRKWGEKLGRDSMQEVLAEHPEMEAALEAAGKAAQQIDHGTLTAGVLTEKEFAAKKAKLLP